jgi:hypothetical protein
VPSAADEIVALDTTVSRHRDLDRRLRENKGRHLRKELAEGLGRVLRMSRKEVDFLDLDATAALRERFFEHVKHARAEERRQWPGSSAEPFLLLRKMALAGAGDNVYLLNRYDYFTGAARVPVAAVLAEAKEVWEVVGEDLCLAGRESSDGLCLAFDHYFDRDEYELTAWGSFAELLARASRASQHGPTSQ